MLRTEVGELAEACVRCDGRGVCPSCEGRGVVAMGLLDATFCDACGGTGRCPECRGSGMALVRDDAIPYTS